MSVIELSSCRICSSTKKPLCPLFRYKHTGNYAEMLTGIADVKVASNDGLPDKICSKCCTCLEKAFLLKTIAERTDKELRKKLEEIKQSIPTKKIAFDSLTDIKSEIGPLSIKSEPKWEVEVDGFNAEMGQCAELSDIVIANTVIRKVEQHTELDNTIDNILEDIKADVTWKTIKRSASIDDVEYLEDDIFIDDDSDAEYIPPTKVKGKSKFKKPKLSDIKVFKEKKKNSVKKNNVFTKTEVSDDLNINNTEDMPGQLITCYPIMRNGCRGPPILLKRPKDATILKIHPNYKARKAALRSKVAIRDKKTVRIIKKHQDDSHKQKEKMVCPVCGILTFTLANHMNTHQEKKRYSCAQCPRSFAQKTNLEVHMKQHSGIKDHICEVCGASFYCQKSLIRHNLIHKGERPFACNLCTKRFIARCDLNRHLRIHSGYKPFKCNTCTMSFNAKHQLQNHERMHTGERPYSCQVCNVAFSYKVNLNNHVLKVHDINLKFKSIHTVTEEILQRENELLGNPPLAHLVPPPGAHETVPHYSM